jgi:hypothetical protein
MVYETHRRYRHLVAELDLDSGSLNQYKADIHFQRVQQNIVHARMKAVHHILRLEADPEFQVNSQ